MVTEADWKLHVAGLFAPLGLATEQVRATTPVKPPLGVIVTGEVLPVVAPAAKVSDVPLTAKLPVVEPVTVTLFDPVAEWKTDELVESGV
jgi:hypothetical protein